MTSTAYPQVPLPPFMTGTAWKKDATSSLVERAVAAGFRAIDTANQLIHDQEAMVGDALQALEKRRHRTSRSRVSRFSRSRHAAALSNP
jgi:diketogulonate reductase-like aldo/keto reductase